MKTYKYILIIIISLLAAACTEEIHIDINSTHPQLVVNASIGLNQPAKVVLMRTLGLNESIDIPLVSEAIVQLTDGDGVSETLIEVSPGIYFSQTMRGKAGQRYELSVKTDTETVTAISSMPEQVKIDSLSVENSIYPGGGPPKGNQKAFFYEIRIMYSDPVEQTNFYRFILYVNGKIVSRKTTTNDRLTNGSETESFQVIYDEEITTGDTITVEMQCIEKPVYEYFSSAGSMGPNPSSPANPYTNLKGAILGYFSAYSLERMEYIISD